MERTSDQTNSSNQQSQVARIVRALNAGKQIVIAVNRKPTIDQMVAAIGLASLINKQSSPYQPTPKISSEAQAKPKIEPLDIKPDKRATKNAVVAFSGQIHPKIGFLQTDKIITKTVDNYRELVISIDKDKADKLRYSLDKKMAKIHISPFLNNQQGLSTKDLEIAPGDFNIDVLVTIGVNEAGDLEPMIGDSIEMLKNCQTITMVTGSKPCQIFESEQSSQQKASSSNKGFKYQSINWYQPEASCLSEMVFGLAKEMKLEFDETIATIILTGFLSATDLVRSRTADATQIEMISQLVKTTGIDNKQMIIDYVQNDALQLSDVDTKSAKQKTAKKEVATGKEQLLTEQEATQRIQEEEVDQVASRPGRGLGLRVASERRVAKAEEKKEDSLTKDLDDVQVDELGQIIPGHGAAAIKPTKEALVVEPAKANPITAADKLGQAKTAPAAMPPIQPAASQQYQPSLIPPPQKDTDQEPDLEAASQPAT